MQQSGETFLQPLVVSPTQWFVAPDLLSILCKMELRIQPGPLLSLPQPGPDVLYHPAQLRKNHPMPGNSTHFTSWMQSEGWGASSRWIIWIKRWLSVVLATHFTTNSHLIWSLHWCSNHRFPGPAASQEMEAKKQMIHISSRVARKTVCHGNCHQPCKALVWAAPPTCSRWWA